MIDRQHGTRGKYDTEGCRCLTCRTAENRRKRTMAANRRARLEAGEVEIEHGTVNGYRGWGCRCRACSLASQGQQKDWWSRVKVELGL